MTSLRPPRRRHRQVVLAASVAVALLIGFEVSASAAVPAPTVTKANELQISAKAADFSLNGMSHQQDAITSLNGWQYVAYYTDVPNRPGVRRVSVARRQMDVWAGGEWQPLEFGDYEQTEADHHNTISMGISPNDGTIHLAFDMHACESGHRLKYRRSVAGLATNPQNFAWNAARFGPVTDKLGTVTMPPPPSACEHGPTALAYPRFVTTPQGDLLLSMRVGISGAGDEHLWTYRSGTWSALGKYLVGGTGNPYLNGLDYGPGGRLHTTWTWRETGAEETNHDLMYAYSDDNGRTWRNNNGTSTAITGSSPVRQSSAFKVETIPQGSGLANGEGQFVDRAGRVHVIMRDTLSGSLRWVHHVRSVADGQWHQRPLPFALPTTTNDEGVQVPTGRRAKIVAHRRPGTTADDLYALLPGLGIASASYDDIYSTWTLVSTADTKRFRASPLFDRHRLADKGILSIIGQQRTTLYSQEWFLGPSPFAAQ